MITYRNSSVKTQYNSHLLPVSSTSFFEKYNFEKLKQEMKRSKNDIGSQFEIQNKENQFDGPGSNYKYLYKLMETKALLNSASGKKREVPRTSASPIRREEICKDLFPRSPNKSHVYANRAKMLKVDFDDNELMQTVKLEISDNFKKSLFKILESI